MAAGHHGNTGFGVRGKRQGCTVHNCNRLAARLAAAQAGQSLVLLPRARSTTTGELPTDTELRLSVGFAAHLREHFPDRRAGFLADAKEAEGNKALPAGATRATTLI